MTDRRPSSTKFRRECFDRNKWQDPITGRIMLTCYICKLPLDPVREEWEAEHVKRRSLGHGNPELLAELDKPENILPAHAECHSPKTAQDVRENAKGKRSSAKHFGIERKRSKLRKPAGMKFDWNQGRYVRVGNEE